MTPKNNCDELVLALLARGTWGCLSEAIKLAGMASYDVKAEILKECLKQGRVEDSLLLVKLLGRKITVLEIDCLTLVNLDNLDNNEALKAAKLGASQLVCSNSALGLAKERKCLGNELTFAVDFAKLGATPAALDTLLEISMKSKQYWAALEFATLGGNKKLIEPLIGMSINDGDLQMLSDAARILERKLSDAVIAIAIRNCLENCMVWESDMYRIDVEEGLRSDAETRIERSIGYLKNAENLLGRNATPAEIGPFVMRLMSGKYLWMALRLAKLGSSRKTVVELFRASVLEGEDSFSMAREIKGPPPQTTEDRWVLPPNIISNGIINSLIEGALKKDDVRLAIDIAEEFGTTMGMKRVIMRAAAQSGSNYYADRAARMLGRKMRPEEVAGLIRVVVDACRRKLGAGPIDASDEHTKYKIEHFVEQPINSVFEISEFNAPKNIHSAPGLEGYRRAMASLVEFCLEAGLPGSVGRSVRCFKRKLTEGETSSLVMQTIRDGRSKVGDVFEAAKLGGREPNSAELAEIIRQISPESHAADVVSVA